MSSCGNLNIQISNQQNYLHLKDLAVNSTVNQIPAVKYNLRRHCIISLKTIRVQTLDLDRISLFGSQAVKIFIHTNVHKFCYPFCHHVFAVSV